MIIERPSEGDRMGRQARRLLAIAAALLVGGCAATTKLSESVGTGLASFTNNLASDWNGRSVSEFRGRFGGPATGTGTAGVSIWQHAEMVWIPEHTEWSTAGDCKVYCTSRTYVVAAHFRKFSCVVSVSVKDGTITGMATSKDDLTGSLGVTSYCQKIFGR